MRYGVHLPVIDFDGQGWRRGGLASYAEAARELGYAAPPGGAACPAGARGPAEECAAVSRACAGAGIDRVFIWPVADAEQQLERFMRDVVPLV